eukprot:m.468739 g.468739  ORF g.468739 m.468739 type:complete len:118 (+) comp21647_c0_seq1:1234-1587(+)
MPWNVRELSRVSGTRVVAEQYTYKQAEEAINATMEMFLSQTSIARWLVNMLSAGINSGMGKLSELLHRRAQRIRQDVAEGEMGPLHVLADETLSILDRATTTIAAYKAWLEKTASAK